MRESVSDLGVFYPERWESLDFVDDGKVERIAGATARARVWTTPTLTMFKQAFGFGPDGRGDSLPARLGDDAGAGARPLPEGAEELLGQGADRGTADALDRRTEPPGQGHRRLGRPHHGRLGYARVVPGLRLHPAPRAGESGRRRPDAVAGPGRRHPQSRGVPSRAEGVGHDRAGETRGTSSSSAPTRSPTSATPPASKALRWAGDGCRARTSTVSSPRPPGGSARRPTDGQRWNTVLPSSSVRTTRAS